MRDVLAPEISEIATPKSDYPQRGSCALGIRGMSAAKVAIFDNDLHNKGRNLRFLAAAARVSRV